MFAFLKLYCRLFLRLFNFLGFKIYNNLLRQFSVIVLSAYFNKFGLVTRKNLLEIMLSLDIGNVFYDINAPFKNQVQGINAYSGNPENLELFSSQPTLQERRNSH